MERRKPVLTDAILGAENVICLCDHCRRARCGLGPDVDGMLGIMWLVWACGLYHRYTDVCTTDIEIHSDTLKHSLLGLWSSHGRDEAPGRAFGASPAYNPPPTCQYSL